MTPKMQTDLMKSTKVFKDFENKFSHFFEECERGFTNEVIINLYCRIFAHDRVVVNYKSNFNEMFFIQQGMVQIFVQQQDQAEEKKGQAILYLPVNSYFGDY